MMTNPMRMLSNRVLATCALVGLLGAAPLSAQAIQLRDGTLLVGEVVDAHSDGLSFRRLDNGGLLELGWDDLSTLFAERIRRAEGLVVEEEGLVTVEADVITFTVSGLKEEVTGLIVGGTDEALLVKRKSGILPIRRDSNPKFRKRRVAALEVYTPTEWYELKRDEIEPVDDPDAHIRLAEEMRRVGLYERTLEHLQRADELGGGKQAAQLDTMLRRARVLLEAAEERELLSEIRVMRNREQFDKAHELVAEFEQRFPDSKLQRELEREKARLDESRELHLVGEIRQLWDRTVRSVATQQARKESLTLSAARGYAEDRMAQDVFASIADVLDIEPREVEELWQKRLEHGYDRLTLYSYGIGSWVLGADAVIAETQVADGGQSTAETSAADRELERLVRKIREAQSRQRRLAQERSGGSEVTEEGWWADAGADDRVSWLRAYFAEFSDHMEVAKAYAAPCATCDGRGHLVQIASTGGGEQKVPCSVCHGTRFTRAIRVR